MRSLLDTLISNPVLAVVLVLGSVAITTFAKVIIARFALDGADSKDKAAIVRALAHLFRWWSGRWWKGGG
jgi:hypothetical protein